MPKLHVRKYHEDLLVQMILSRIYTVPNVMNYTGNSNSAIDAYFFRNF